MAMSAVNCLKQALVQLKLGHCVASTYAKTFPEKDSALHTDTAPAKRPIWLPGRTRGDAKLQTKEASTHSLILSRAESSFSTPAAHISRARHEKAATDGLGGRKESFRPKQLYFPGCLLPEDIFHAWMGGSIIHVEPQNLKSTNAKLIKGT
jgi:hypothetical protein